MNSIHYSGKNHHRSTPFAGLKGKVVNGIDSLGLTPYLDFLLGEVDDAWSFTRKPARVISITEETKYTRTIVLKPTYEMPVFISGQFVGIEFEVNGVRLTRNYSFSSSPKLFQDKGIFSITVKRQASGRVSNALHDNLHVGDVVHIGQVSGEFVMPAVKNKHKTVLVAAGSGITPFMSMLESFSETLQAADISLIYYAATDQDFIFGERLQALSDALDGFTYLPVASDEHGNINKAQVESRLNALQDAHVMLCGPAGFMEAARNIFTELGVADDQIIQESFGGPVQRADVDASVGSVTFSLAGITLETDGKKSLLELAESAGLTPKFGCRSGVCHECKCKKTAGQVMDIRNGRVDSVDDQVVQTCIAVPHGDVCIEL